MCSLVSVFIPKYREWEAYGEHSDILIRESSFEERGYGDKRRFEKNIYIKSMKLNGKPYDSTWIDWDQLNNGATIEYTTSSKPDVKWGTKVTPPLSLKAN